MYVVGTAGHVDHGKSSLVQSLTGIDPDRLSEEKARGMTIDLGFAWLKLPSGGEVSIVDVPGHERFISNMLAGVGGIDLALLVVAADESVMPQTREHLAILDLLQVKHGLAVITKKDLVDQDWMELVSTDVATALRGTVFQDVPVIQVSSVTGEGLPELVLAIERLLTGLTSKRDLHRPRLPIDRFFTMSGFGTVVTGTLIDGELSVGQEVELVLSNVVTKIRGLQTHRKKQERVVPGTRVAANLSGVGYDTIPRGEVLTNPGWLRPTTAMDVHLRLLPDMSHSIRHNMFVTVHTGSSESIGRLRLLEGDTAEPGASTWAQLKLNSPLAVLKGDGFVIRSSMITLGGGRIVDPHARRHKRRHVPTIDRLAVLETGEEQDVLLNIIESLQPTTLATLLNSSNIEPGVAADKINSLIDQGLVLNIGRRSGTYDGYLYSAKGWIALTHKVSVLLARHHTDFPLRKGIAKEELRNRIGMATQIFNDVLDKMVKDGNIEEAKLFVRMPGHYPVLNQSQQIDADIYLRQISVNPYSPASEICLSDEVINLLDEQGKVAKMNEVVVFSTEAYEDMLKGVSGHIKCNGNITIAEVRDMFKTTRKYALALMDYLDYKRITRRVGDARILRE